MEYPSSFLFYLWLFQFGLFRMNILTRLLRNIIHSISNRLSTIEKTESATKIQNISKVLGEMIERGINMIGC